MAGGDEFDRRAPYPFGLYLFQTHNFPIIASQSSDFKVDQILVPFTFKPVRAEFTCHSMTVTNGVTINVEDDTGTPKVIIVNKSVGASVTAGATVRVALAVDKTVTIFGAALLTFSYISGASDEAEYAGVRLWVEPVMA